jgi:alkylated DNA repair dioxygenase AlkB
MQGCKCDYKYGKSTWIPSQSPQHIQLIGQELATLLGVPPPNGVNANFYGTCDHHLDWHADDEPLFQQSDGTALIVSISFGSSTSFEWKRNVTGERSWTTLENADILIMEGRTQQFYKHQVPPYSQWPEGSRGSDSMPPPFERHNLTFRWTVNHTKHCLSKAARNP